MTQHLNVTRLQSTFAGLIDGLTIDSELDLGTRRNVYESFVDHKVLVLRNHNAGAREFALFGKIFGEPDMHHVVKLRHPDEPTLTYISNQRELGRNEEMRYSGDGWHSDYSYKLVPSAATMLLGMEIPEQGGDTLFADAEAAFADLPNSEKTSLRKLRVRHQYRWSPDREDPWARWKYIGEDERRATPEITHPLVRIHPDSGKEVLFIQPRVIGSVVAIEGMEERESTQLIGNLIDHITMDKYVYRHSWLAGDIVVWDNRSVIHSATTKGLPEQYVRKLLRLTTKGSPVTPADPSVGISRLSEKQDDFGREAA